MSIWRISIDQKMYTDIVKQVLRHSSKYYLLYKVTKPEGYSRESLMGVCRPILQILTLFQTKKYHFLHPFLDLASKIHTLFQIYPIRNYVIINLIRTPAKREARFDASIIFYIIRPLQAYFSFTSLKNALLT